MLKRQLKQRSCAGSRARVDVHGGLLAVPKGTCSHQGFLRDGRGYAGGQCGSGFRTEWWGPGGSPEGLSLVLVWMTQSQEAKAKEELPGCCWRSC